MDEDDTEYEGEYGQYDGEFQQVPGDYQNPQYEGNEETENYENPDEFNPMV